MKSPSYQIHGILGQVTSAPRTTAQDGRAIVVFTVTVDGDTYHVGCADEALANKARGKVGRGSWVFVTGKLKVSAADNEPGYTLALAAKTLAIAGQGQPVEIPDNIIGDVPF